MEDDRNYADECGDHGGTNRHDEPCGRPAGWGTDSGTGRCRQHLGTSPDGSSHEGNDHAKGHGAPEGNTNSVSHGAYTEGKKLYSEVFTERERDLADWVYDDYHGRYIDRHDAEPPAGFQLRLFNIAVNVVTEMRVENWYSDKPDSLDTGTPNIDRETHVSEGGERYYRYKKSPATAAVKHLSDYNHKWLKAMDLFPDGDPDVSVNIQAEMWEDQTAYYDG